MFFAYSALYGFLVLAAPLVFTALSWKGGRSYRGLLLADCVVLWAVLGETGTALLLLVRGGVPPWFGVLVFSGVAAGLFFYARASTAKVIEPVTVDFDGDTAATTAAATTAAMATLWRMPSVDVQKKAKLAAEDVLTAANKIPKGGAQAQVAQRPLGSVPVRQTNSLML